MAKSNGNGSSGGLATFEEHETGLAAETTSPSSIGVAAEQARVMAEAQAALAVAAARPRNHRKVMDRIQAGCERVGLAEAAEYNYSRGGTDIQGATIDLLSHIAACWGNIRFGFRVLATRGDSSTVEAFAWDLETNAYVPRTFDVPHKGPGKNGKLLTDGRDIYETIANSAQRRVRACLEAIIPVDVVEQARTWCAQTLHVNVEVTAESIKKLVEAFAGFGVTVEQLETRVQRRLDTMSPAQFVSLRKIYKSLKDGMSKPDQWFDAVASEASATNQSTKDKLRKPKASPAPAPSEEPEAVDEAPSPKPPGDIRAATKLLTSCKNDDEVRAVEKKLLDEFTWSEGDAKHIDALVTEMLAG